METVYVEAHTKLDANNHTMKENANATFSVINVSNIRSCNSSNESCI